MDNLLYVYATGDRADGYGYAVGHYLDGVVDGARAMFRTKDDAHTFVYAVQAATGVEVSILPSSV